MISWLCADSIDWSEKLYGTTKPGSHTSHSGKLNFKSSLLSPLWTKSNIWQREDSSSSSNSIELFEGGKVARWLETKLVIFFCLRRLNIPIEELISDVDKMEILLHNFTIERKKAKSLEVKTTKILIRTWPFKLVRANSSFPNLNVKGEDVSKMSSVNPHSLRYIKPLSTWALMRFYNSDCCDTLSRWAQWSWALISSRTPYHW